MAVSFDHFLSVLLLQFTTPGGTVLLQPNIFITVLGVASTVGYQAKHVSSVLLFVTWFLFIRNLKLLFSAYTYSIQRISDIVMMHCTKP